jgi:hypothetical protein
MGNFFKILTLFLAGSLVVLVVTHSKGFSQSAGTAFKMFNDFANVLTKPE